MSGISEMLSYEFMVRALIAGVAVSLAAGLIGVPLVLRKKSLIGDGLSHAAFAAVAIATVMGLTPLWVALPVVIITSFVILKAGENHKLNGDALVAVLAVSSLAIGTMAISVVQGINIDLNSYLFGSVLAVGWEEVCLSLIIAAAVTLFYILMSHRIFAVTFDEEFAQATGVKVKLFETLLAVACSVVVVLGMRLLGALLISGLIIFPVLIAIQFVRSFKGVVIWAAIISVMNFIIGLMVSYFAVLPTGATVVAVNLLGLVLVVLARKCVRAN